MSDHGGRRGGPAGASSERQTIDQNLVKVLAHPIRVCILEAMQGRVVNSVGLTLEFGSESLGVLAFHVKTLEKYEAIEEVDNAKRRGTFEHFYTVRPRSFIGRRDWRRAPLSVRGGVTGEALRTFVAKIGAAIDADTIDSREDTTLNWMPITVDEQGWRETAEILDQALRRLMAVAAASRERLGGADGIPVVTGLAAFEVPPGGGST
jgi:hypothetical protein